MPKSNKRFDADQIPRQHQRRERSSHQDSSKPESAVVKGVSESPPVNVVGHDFSKATYERHIALLRDSRMYDQQRAELVQRLGRDYGNRYVQRLVGDIQRERPSEQLMSKPKKEGEEDKLQEKAKVEGQEEKLQAKSKDLLQRDDTNAPPVVALPVGPTYAPGKHVTPDFVLDEPDPTRSNATPSTTAGENPTFVGHAAVDEVGRKWKYELDSVEAKGTIKIVYYTEEHYPAPDPTDDTGELSNVSEENWEDIVDTLEDEKTGVATTWSAFAAEDVHEAYHWEDEWQVEVRKAVIKAETEIAKLSVNFDDAATQAEANTLLLPDAKTAFDEAMAQARTIWNAMGDSAGDPPYLTQPDVIDPLIERVEDYASTEGWDEDDAD